MIRPSCAGAPRIPHGLVGRRTLHRSTVRSQVPNEDVALLGLFRRSPRPLSSTERSLLDERVAAPWALSADERQRLVTATTELVHRLDWEAARDFEITDEMPVTVAGFASLLALGLDDPDPWRKVTSVVLHRGGMTLHETRPGPSLGVVASGPRRVQGHTTAHGPVFISWATVRRELAAPQAATNVVLHEFAHQLDMLDGVVDGTPPLDEPFRTEWVATMTAHFDAQVHDPTTAPLRRYAMNGPGEFFAVATETFFQQPHRLANAPELYDVLRRYYGQDPASRRPPPEG